MNSNCAEMVYHNFFNINVFESVRVIDKLRLILYSFLV